MAMYITNNIIAITNLVSQMKTLGGGEDKRLSEMCPL